MLLQIGKQPGVAEAVRVVLAKGSEELPCFSAGLGATDQFHRSAGEGTFPLGPLMSLGFLPRLGWVSSALIVQCQGLSLLGVGLS